MTLAIILTLGLILISKAFRGKYFKTTVETKFDNKLFEMGVNYVINETKNKKEIVITNSSFIINKFFDHMEKKFSNITVVVKLLDDAKQVIQSELANQQINDIDEFVDKLARKIID